MPVLVGVKPPLFAADVAPDRTIGLSPVRPEPNRETRPRSSLAYANSSTPKSVEYAPAQKQLYMATTEYQRYQRPAPEPSSAPVLPTGPLPQLRRALGPGGPPRTPVRRTKSEGHVQTTGATEGADSVVPRVCTDATLCDRLWSKLDPPNHRDSMSSSSSLSSSDTVIDLSMPNLARQTPPWPGRAHAPLRSCSSAHVTKSNPNLQQTLAPLRSCSSANVTKSNPNLQQPLAPLRSCSSAHVTKSNPNLQQPLAPLRSCSSAHVAKSKSNPNLQQPLQSPPDPPDRQSERKHTWSRLFMEGLRQSGGAPATASMSKSLGDLTSDDISPSFDSKYRSISRSFIIRPPRGALRRGCPPPADTLTAQLRRLTDVEPLTLADLAPPMVHESREDSVDEGLVRRTSSRSQSRVRYIANRAKKAQERQRLQGLCRGSGGTPLEERGNPEGACCVAQSPCSSLDLLNQLVPPNPPTPRNLQLSSDPGGFIC